MSEYVFTLKYQLPAEAPDADTLVERLAAAGCDDALVGTGVPGRLALEFTREADDAAEAVRSALADINSAIPDAQLIEAAPDFVGITDVARILGTSRQYVRKLMVTSGSGFPTPVHEGHASIWHLAEVLEWLRQQKGYRLDERQIETARIALELNLVKERHRAAAYATHGFDSLIA